MGTLLLTVISLFAFQAPATKIYQHNQCDFSFEYPSDWQIVKNPDYFTEDCATTLRPVATANPAPQDEELYTLTVQVSDRSFLQVSAENGFDFDGTWIVMGRQGIIDEAQIRKTGDWLILRGIATAGCDLGGQTALCSEYRVVARRKNDDHVVSITGGAQTEKVLELILKTFKFQTH